MRSFQSSKNYQDKNDRQEKSSAQLYANMILCLAVIFFSIFGFQWILSDVSGVYSVADRKMRSPVILSLVRKPTRLEGELSLSSSEMLTLNNSDNTKDDQLHLVFVSSQTTNKKKQPLVVRLDGVYDDGKINATLSSGGQSFKLTLQRDPSASIHKILRAHLPY